MNASHAVLELTGVTAVHGEGKRARTVLSPTSLAVMPGESVAVVGRSGAGKSTLADIALGLRHPASGTVLVQGTEWCTASRRPRPDRRHLVQGVPQDPAAAFVPRRTLRRSIEQAVRRLTGEANPAERIRRAAELASLDPALLDRRPGELSGGQAQRAALARALAVKPVLLVADEPSSALDAATAAAVSASLLSLVQDTGIALLLVTHDPAFAARCTRTVTLTAPADASGLAA
ncbi:ABC transporter ATP-binding protein [Arthrobacter sp. SW1]|uniref:ATP-binding cassette domain-containing protein n=1 Tax=Arthrobacter sp. SW1 TaxID=1920889 RepID=UPI000877D934|nr:ATP-binding cassette domain-containing protein [Arthrobacter sp. SW1]OFI37647.1 ABC transporter ATP-binding protein [Arthrobacter sp. SW1]